MASASRRITNKGRYRALGLIAPAADAKPTPLTDGVMDDPIVVTQHLALEIDDLARSAAPGRSFSTTDGNFHWARTDILAFRLVGDFQAIAPRQVARLGLGQIAERKTQVIECSAVVANRK